MGVPPEFVLGSEAIWSSRLAKLYSWFPIRRLKALLSSIGSVESHWLDKKTPLHERSKSSYGKLDQKDTWSDLDRDDLASASLHYASTLYSEEEDFAPAIGNESSK